MITTDIDLARAVLLIDASVQAYNFYDKKYPFKAPPGYEQVGSFTGVDTLGWSYVELFGVVFRATVDGPQAPAPYIFSFRGTDSLMDTVEDLFANQDRFRPFRPTTKYTGNGLVAAGFWSVYSACTNSSVSMQAQVFSLLQQFQASEHPISELMITGHSLGAALSELFTLDVALSSFASIPTVSYNFACPRLGDDVFADLYNSQPRQSESGGKTLSIQNTYDSVPCMPSTPLTTYVAVGDAYLLSFYRNLLINPFAKYDDHSALNYQAVLECASQTSDGICVSDAVQSKVNGQTLLSMKPNPSSFCR